MSVVDSGILLAGPRRRPRLPAIRLVEAFAYALLAAFIFFICFTFLRPSPYDFFAIPAMALWFCLGIRLHRSSVTFVALLLAYHLGLLISLLPYFDEPRTVEWTYQSVYLMLTAIFFAMLFSDDTAKRIEFVLKAYLASCLFAAAAGIASYYDLFDGILFKMDGRAAGVFEDPNVLGSPHSGRALPVAQPHRRALARAALRGGGARLDCGGDLLFVFARVLARDGRRDRNHIWGLEAARLKWATGAPIRA
jgi:hypothetical protein